MKLISPVAALAAGAVSAAEFEFPLRNGRNQFSTLIGVGTPAQYFPMLLDSGSEEVLTASYLWNIQSQLASVCAENCSTTKNF